MHGQLPLVSIVSFMSIYEHSRDVEYPAASREEMSWLLFFLNGLGYAETHQREFVVAENEVRNTSIVINRQDCG